MTDEYGRDPAVRQTAIIKALFAIGKLSDNGEHPDHEGEHGDRDRILLELLDVLAPEVAEAARLRETKVGYWYA